MTRNRNHNLNKASALQNIADRLLDHAKHLSNPNAHRAPADTLTSLAKQLLDLED